ncbi:MAG: hypothetical protein M3Z28_00440 [Candidatus Dormibacteraeota bacterium]|nr:hypothetical protein [Candidatus Dormibacteraeota bacterium]
MIRSLRFGILALALAGLVSTVGPATVSAHAFSGCVTQAPVQKDGWGTRYAFGQRLTIHVWLIEQECAGNGDYWTYRRGMDIRFPNGGGYNASSLQIHGRSWVCGSKKFDSWRSAANTFSVGLDDGQGPYFGCASQTDASFYVSDSQFSSWSYYLSF